MTSHHPTTIALTGGIACGKSETGRILAEQGFAVLDTDLLAHELMRGGTAVFLKVVERFGEQVVGADGNLDRAVLGRIVFEDPAARDALNRMVHPAVIEAAEQWKAAQTGDAAVMVPLLFEAGWVDEWDAIICVSADDETVFQRLEKRGLNRTEAACRMAAQMPLQEKKRRSDFTVENNGTLDALRNEVLSVLACIRSKRNADE
jgi:dephospho-CoA kinase